MTNVTFHTDVECKYVQGLASDEFVLHAARISTDPEVMARTEEALETGELRGLIRFLMKNRHGTPFEHNMFTFFVKAPIFVFREYHRHRIGHSYNEMSGRYTELLPEFYVPGEGRNMVRQEGTKTGAYRYEPDEELRERFCDALKQQNINSWHNYQWALSEGVVNEVARMGLPVNIFSQMWDTTNARAIMSFLSLRTEREKGYIVPDDLVGQLPVNVDGDGPLTDGEWALFPSRPQKEIQLVADRIEAAFAEQMPLTYEAWNMNGRVAP